MFPVRLLNFSGRPGRPIRSSHEIIKYFKQESAAEVSVFTFAGTSRVFWATARADP